MTLGRKRKFMVMSEIQYFSFFSEQLQLLSRCVRLLRLATVKKLDICKLLVSNTKHTDFTIRWQQTLDSAHMHLCILHAATMTNVYRKLKHGEPIALQCLTKISISPFVLLCFGGKIEEYQNPHYSVFAKSFESNHYPSDFGQRHPTQFSRVTFV